ncbi:MAG: D-2-hydroxyacid dehydrogenase [Thermomicrobiales bacterium]
MSETTPLVVLIASPLEAEYVTQIADAFPGEIELIYPSHLMPPTRYRGDHGHYDRGLTGEKQQEWHDLLRRADVLFDFPEYEQLPFGELCPRVRWVQTSSAGVGPMVRDLGLQDADLLVTTASGLHAQPLTEFAFAAILYHSKELGRLQNEQLERSWRRFSGRELAGSTIAIIGPGRIGQEVARVARAFRMRVVALGRHVDPARAAALGFDHLYARPDLHTMLGEADYLVLCAPHTPETDTIMDAAAFAAVKPGLGLVNIGRGALVDEDALLAALRDGRLAFAALDVFRKEPLPPESPFWSQPNVLINPHSASTVDTENAKLTARFIENLRAYLDGRTGDMGPVLDKRRLY